MTNQIRITNERMTKPGNAHCHAERSEGFVSKWTLGLAVVALFCAFAQAGPTTRPSAESIERAFAKLADVNPHVRESARQQLMKLGRDDLPVLRSVVEKARPLRPAQAIILRQIVEEIFLAAQPYEPESKHGFMGILMDDSESQADFVPDNELQRPLGVIVAERIPGFCASRKLLEGDVLLGIASPGRLFRNSRDLRDAIEQYPAGAQVPLLVLRRGQVMEITLTLNAHPLEITSTDQIPLFNAKRQKKFQEYWAREYEPLFAGALF